VYPPCLELEPESQAIFDALPLHRQIVAVQMMMSALFMTGAINVEEFERELLAFYWRAASRVWAPD
jgi:hypothetical protein